MRAPIVGVAAVILTQIVFFSPLLALRPGGVAVRGTGVAEVTDGDVKVVVAEYVGTSLIRLNTSEIESKVHRSLPVVKQAKVT